MAGLDEIGSERQPGKSLFDQAPHGVRRGITIAPCQHGNNVASMIRIGLLICIHRLITYKAQEDVFEQKYEPSARLLPR